MNVLIHTIAACFLLLVVFEAIKLVRPSIDERIAMTRWEDAERLFQRALSGDSAIRDQVKAAYQHIFRDSKGFRGLPGLRLPENPKFTNNSPVCGLRLGRD